MKWFLRFKKPGAIFLVVFTGLVFFYISKSSNNLLTSITLEAVVRGKVNEVVSETGSVVAAQEANLAFERGGKISEILVKEGAYVHEGDMLVKLDATEKAAELTSARARLDAEELRLEELLRGSDSVSLGVTASGLEAAKVALMNAEDNLVEVTAQQDLLVKNAQETLRSSGLEAYIIDGEQENSEHVYTAPTISGTYTGEEGVYMIELYNSGAQSGSSFRVTGIENDVQNVSTVGPVLLGTQGLYIQFPEGYGSRTKWEIPIPNTRGSSYLANVNAYEAALETRNLALRSAVSAVRSAEATLAQRRAELLLASSSARDERVGAERAVVEQMQAALLIAKNSYDNMTLRAPFSGTVTAIHGEVGEMAGPATPVVEMISDQSLELVVYISESDIQEVSIGDEATAVFDAYNGLTAHAHVARIAPSAKLVDGVRVFEVRLQFDEVYDQIKSGISADIDIAAATRDNVIAVPTRAIIENEKGKFVRALEGTKLVYIPIETGLHGSDGTTEIVNGLTEGQEIITFAEESVIKQLEAQ